MAIIPQMSLFDYREIQSLGDLERLRLVRTPSKFDISCKVNCSKDREHR